MNIEPVAWMLNGKLHECDPSDWAKEEYPSDDVIPLYTHPAKTLTDEEIDNLIMDVAEKPTDEDLFDFARAILRKAQER